MGDNSSREEFYKLAAANYAGTAVIRKMTASVHVEGTSDIHFWKKVFKEFYPQGKFNFIAHSKSYNENRENNSMASGSMHCLNYKPYLSDKFFICIDSDERYLREEQDINIKNYIFQTYTYSIENHYCFAPKLNYGCLIATGVDVKQYLPILTKNFFDFRVFLKAYSNTIYELFIWHIYFSKTDSSELCVIPFNNIITIKGKIPYNQVAHNGAGLISRLRDKVRSKINKLERDYPDIDIQQTKKELQKLGVTPDNVYLFIRGHNLLGFVSKIGERCCEYLLNLEKENKGYNKESIRKIHERTKSFKNVIQRKIWFRGYSCIDKVKHDINWFFEK
ncbi:DUF4435 domain-containing protein [Bacteroidales bacterium OttesenSCG-928-K03]|nr:DUF4435 domain-containing protein [Odoribacter sp. OttesenSCG-928-L07]MDL2240144.1 DUF4435 domain-containing protein [Bacteroidales bacterium OttesenSCG-928-K22]MDL2243181.1 DUF4435 domain-containing protein [Bacteroidales bacterium OttesenSCG-928-K03]